MYDSFSRHYDHFVNWENRLDFEMPFLVEKIKSAFPSTTDPIWILDAATGTGMHAITLAKEGFKTVGVDISQGMIDAARENAQRHTVETTFFTAGFGEIFGTLTAAEKEEGAAQADRRLLFHAVLCLGNSLPHAADRSALVEALRDFAQCLVPGGLLLLQNRNFDVVLSQKERWMEPQTFLDDGQEYIFLRFYDFLPDGYIQFNVVTLRRTLQKEWRQSILSTRLFPLPRAVLLDALREAGFDQIREYGALADTPFQVEKSANLVITAIKK